MGVSGIFSSDLLFARDSPSEPARRRLVEGNLGVVVSIARRYPDAGVQVLDLIQTGKNALLAALDTFGTSSFDRFPDHADSCVERAIRASLPPGT